MSKIATATATRTYQIDKAHSEAAFQVRHLLTKVRGRFSDFQGTVVLDEAKPERSSVSITIQAASIDTSEPSRDAHLRSADFFAVDEFATLTFTSTEMVPAGKDLLEVTGDLTVRGVTKRDCRARRAPRQGEGPLGLGAPGFRGRVHDQP